MNDRDRIAEIIRNARIFADPLSQVGYAEADALLANGVIVQKQDEWVSEPIKYKGYDSKTIPTCTSCGYQSFIKYTYCPECGAKLKELG